MEETQKPNTLRRSMSFMKRHPILFNFLLIILVGFSVIWMALIGLDVWTDHGAYEVVPDMKGLSYNQAVKALESVGLKPELSDSIYDMTTAPGTVLEQSPRARTKVKPHRTVYLTVTAFSPKMISLPAVTDMSLRQARSTLEGAGIRNICEVLVPSEYKDLVLGVKFNGVSVQPGARVPTSATITIEVGEGLSLDVDSVDTLEAIESDREASVLNLE
ncbi:PASTA domain-containing protein [Muribaculum intestinale]|uniref:PASTA domain-containing protein n=1 Tax=Muribaculum intestinale TaxID=1796646 RepID=UPI00272A25A8|nr:PASTA domain-containing protein [Muribaculum intestinale]